MYQPYPGGSAQLPEPSRPSAPQSIQRAVQAMYAGAAASLISLIIGLTTLGSLKSEIHTASPTLTTAQVNSAYHGAIAVIIIAGIVGIGLWIWMARMNAAGRGWARIVATVFFAIDTIDTLVGLAGSHLTGSTAARFFGIVVWLIGLAAIFFLYQRDSSEYFQASKRKY